MLKNERWAKIIKIVEERDTITTSELSNLLDISQPTIRRDIIELSQLGKVIKVFGGISKVNNEDFVFEDSELVNRYNEFPNDKREIGKIAAKFIKNNDMVYLDAGSTVEAMLQFIDKNKEANYVTDSLAIASKLSKLSINVYLLPGIVKGKTDSVIGSSTILELQRFNFNVGFFGTNGISLKSGFTTPDMEEAEVKKMAMGKCKKVYVLSDISKFSKTSGITFSNLDKKISLITYIDKAKMEDERQDKVLKDFKDKITILSVED